jgi:hypothetical protein
MATKNPKQFMKKLRTDCLEEIRYFEAKNSRNAGDVRELAFFKENLTKIDEFLKKDSITLEDCDTVNW